MSRMNERTRKRLYSMLVSRDGEFCATCGKAGLSETLVVDHIDNNNANNDPDNLQLLCRSCNTKKNPRGKAKPRNASAEVHEQSASRELIKNEKCEPLFRQWIETQVSKWSRLELKDAVNSGAEVAGVSPATSMRYLDKMTSSAGKLRVTTIDEVKFIQFKEYWSPK